MLQKNNINLTNKSNNNQSGNILNQTPQISLSAQKTHKSNRSESFRNEGKTEKNLIDLQAVF